MEITEVRIKLVEKNSERLRAFCSITLDGDFVIRDLKIIDGTNGVFVAMPSRKLMDRCPRCGAKNHLRARFCNECGAKLLEDRAPRDAQGRGKLHADVAHPINAACRERLQNAVIQAYHTEFEKSKSPDYRPTKYDEFEGFEDYDETHAATAAHAAKPAPPKQEAVAPSNNRRDARPAPEPRSEFGDYNDLIADLKREAADRHRDDHGGRNERESSGAGRSGEAGLDRNSLRTSPDETFDDAPTPTPSGAGGAKTSTGSDDFGAGL